MRVILFLSVFALSVLCAAPLLPLPDVSDSAALVNSFANFKVVFNKVYSTNEEEMMRFSNFKASVARITMKNKKHIAEGGEAVFGITKYADLSVQEFKNSLLKYKPVASAMRDAAIAKASVQSRKTDNVEISRVNAGLSCLSANATKTCDWRRAGAITPVKDQGQCGSCWAFSATEEIESMNFLKNKKLLELAPQQIVSCDQVDQACNGGDTPTAYKYVIQAGGLEGEADYPYRSGDGNDYTCRFNKAEVIAKITGFTYAIPPCNDACDNQNEALLASNMAKTGPVSVCLNAQPWQDYVGGILRSGCGHSVDDMDHCVQLVGYDQSNATPFWIIRNSWNTDWGIEGYIHVAIKDNLCGVANEATFVTAAQ